MNTTSSSENCWSASSAVSRWPWWIGSNVPPITPRRAVMRSRTRPGELAERLEMIGVVLRARLPEPLLGTGVDLVERAELLQRAVARGRQLRADRVQLEVGLGHPPLDVAAHHAEPFALLPDREAIASGAQDDEGPALGRVRRGLAGGRPEPLRERVDALAGHRRHGHEIVPAAERCRGM